MAFTDLTFLFIFLPAALFLYYVVAVKLQPMILLALSLLFYACGSWQYFRLLVTALAVDLAIGLLIARTRQQHKFLSAASLFAGIFFHVFLLGYYKYFDFALDISNRIFLTSFESRNIILPLGISYFTFKSISYQIDLYRGKITEFRPLTAAVYLSFFGQIQSGPIARYEDFDKKASTSVFLDGASKFMIGFGKKVLLANVLSNVATEIFDNTAQLSTSLAWLGAFCYSLQLFYDFSGYSDMAEGICNLFGLKCPINFRYPYISKSFSEFWRRWHITLGSWFRDYIYIPMGGSRVGRLRLYFNLFVVWILTGLWHGASLHFVFWGLGSFMLIALEKAFSLPGRIQTKIGQQLYRIPVIIGIVCSWVVFRCGGMRQSILFLKTMLMPLSNEIASARAAFLLKDYSVFILFGILFAIPVIPVIEVWSQKHRITHLVFQAAFILCVCGIFLCALSMIVSGQNNPFLYANF